MDITYLNHKNKMPRPKRKRSFKRRTRKRLRRFRKSNKPLILGGFPKSKLVKLRYVEFITINPGTSAIANHVFRANSMYDPNSTGVGHQPSNFDRWTNIYDHYTVLGSKITIRHTPTVTTSGVLAILGVALTDSGTETAGLTAEQLLEKKLVKSSWRSVGLTGSGHGMKSIKHAFSAKKFFGKKNGIVNDGTYRGKMGNLGVGSDPTEQAFYEVFAGATGDGQDPAGLRLLVTIDYIGVLSEPKMDDES